METGTVLQETCAGALDDLLEDGPFHIKDYGYDFLAFLGYSMGQIDEAVRQLVAQGRAEIVDDDGRKAIQRSERWRDLLSNKLASADLLETVRDAITYDAGPGYRDWQTEADYAALCDVVVRALVGAGFRKGEILDIFSRYPIGRAAGYLESQEWRDWVSGILDQLSKEMAEVNDLELAETSEKPTGTGQKPTGGIQKPAEAKRPLPAGDNFEVVRVVRTPPPRATYRLTIRRTDKGPDNGTEGTIVLSPAKILSMQDFRAACINAMNFCPTLSDRMTWINFAEKVLACAEPAATEDIAGRGDTTAKPREGTAIVNPSMKPYEGTVGEEWVKDDPGYEEADKLLVRVVEFMLGESGSWTGTATQLLSKITGRIADPPYGWPHSAATLGIALHRCADAFSSLGIHLAFRRMPGGNRDRHMQLQRKAYTFPRSTPMGQMGDR